MWEWAERFVPFNQLEQLRYNLGMGPPPNPPRATSCRFNFRCRPKQRINIGDGVTLYAWPSLGGVIIIDHAEAVDFEFLNLDRINPPTDRFSSQDDEDAFCQRMLLLGAKWWDSEARFKFVSSAAANDTHTIVLLDDGKEPEPTMRERRWVSVGWPSTGGLWVAEFDTVLWVVEEEDNLLPPETGLLSLAKTMDERCEVLRIHFNAKFYNDLKDYEGFAFLNSWAQRKVGDGRGEVGPLVQAAKTMTELS